MNAPDSRPLFLVDAPAGPKAKPAPPKRRRDAARPARGAASGLSRLLSDYRSWEEAETADRSDKVVEAKLRVSQGYYDRPEVREKVLRALLRDLLPPSPVRATGKKKTKSAARKDRPASR